MADIWTLLQRRLRSQPAAPLVTWVDGASRVELSATTLANAATKIANGLRDELDLQPGARVGLDLGAHWQCSTWCAGIWVAGCVVDTATATKDDLGAVDLQVVGAGRAGAVTAAGQVGVLSLHPLGLPDRGALPSGALDLSRLIPAQPDQLLFQPATGSAPCYRSDHRVATQDELLQVAAELAGDWGLQAGGRLLAPADLDPERLWLACLAVPLVAGAAVVLAPNSDPRDAGLVRREGITATAG